MESTRKETLVKVLRQLESVRDQLKSLCSVERTNPVSAQESGWFGKYFSRWFGGPATIKDGEDLGMLLDVQSLIAECKKKIAVAIAKEWKAKRETTSEEDKR